MMTPKERAAMQKALEALEEMFHSNSTKVAVEKYNTAHNALREALKVTESNISDHKLAEQAEQEPVAEVHNTDTPSNWSIIKPGLPAGTKLYAAPVRTKDLTDDEIYTLYSEPCSDREMVEFARAVIAADREKNK